MSCQCFFEKKYYAVFDASQLQWFSSARTDISLMITNSCLHGFIFYFLYFLIAGVQSRSASIIFKRL